MIYIKIFSFLKKFLIFIANCRIYVGRRPAAVPAPAIIFFPLLRSQLSCGFAGLMTCRLQEQRGALTADRTLASGWKKIKDAGLQTVLAGKNAAADYLSGLEAISAIDSAVAELKREDAQEFIFFRQDRAAQLFDIAGEIKQFLADEEKMLEDRAAVINSADLEVINSRILLLKDICWMLEKDILANLQKVLALTGAESFSAVAPAAFRKYRKLNLLLNALDRLEVRGRDSAGIQLTFVMKDEKEMSDTIRRLDESGLKEDYQRRAQKGDLLNSSIFISTDQNASSGGSAVTFTYKTFSIVGELGRNVADLRNYISNDRILQCFAASEADL